jgi:hypothetical protein
VKQKILQKLKNFGPKQWLILIAFVSVLGFTSFYIFRTVQFAVYWQQHRDVPISGWMNIGYVAHSYHVPPPELNKAVGLAPDERDRRPLAEIAKSQNRPFEELKIALEKAIGDFRAAHPTPPDARAAP